MKTLHTRTDCRRSGFTIIEIMVAVVIIAILAGLLLTALGGVQGTARVAEVKSDISKLEAGLENFKTRYGVYPPSSISFYEDPTQWDAKSRSILSRLWPRFNFAIVRELDGQPGSTGVVNLDGAECLVFFLGGVVDLDVTKPIGDPLRGSGAYTGFSKDPANPLKRDTSNVTSRDGPFYEFAGGFDPDVADPVPTANSRLVDVDGDDYLELMDTLPSQQLPYVYFVDSGSGFRAADNTGRIGGPYYEDGAKRKAYKSGRFQIISPGSDGRYGTGGTYQKDKASALNADDADNITNFHGGQLKDA